MMPKTFMIYDIRDRRTCVLEDIESIMCRAPRQSLIGKIPASRCTTARDSAMPLNYGAEMYITTIKYYLPVQQKVFDDIKIF